MDFQWPLYRRWPRAAHSVICFSSRYGTAFGLARKKAPATTDEYSARSRPAWDQRRKAVAGGRCRTAGETRKYSTAASHDRREWPASSTPSSAQARKSCSARTGRRASAAVRYSGASVGEWATSLRSTSSRKCWSMVMCEWSIAGGSLSTDVTDSHRCGWGDPQRGREGVEWRLEVGNQGGGTDSR